MERNILTNDIFQFERWIEIEILPPRYNNYSQLDYLICDRSMDSWDNRQRLASVWCESSNPPSLPVELGTDERTNGWTDEPTDGLSFAYDEPVAALTARGRGTSYKSPGTGNWNEGSSDRGSIQETISTGESSFIGRAMTRPGTFIRGGNESAD